MHSEVLPTKSLTSVPSLLANTFHLTNMTNLRRFSLTQDKKAEDWKLVDDQTQRTVRRFNTKGTATAGGVLGGALGTQGGSVRIHLENGRFEEERTFPRSADPRESTG